MAIVSWSWSALGVGGYILAHQRFYLPEWVPGGRHGLLRLKAEFPTAQAVTPGQGQTVDIAGVDGRRDQERRPRRTAAPS